MSILMGGNGDGSMTNLEGLDLLNFIMEFGKGTPKITITQGAAGNTTVAMSWLGWQGVQYSQDGIVNALEGVAGLLQGAIEGGLLKEDTSG